MLQGTFKPDNLDSGDNVKNVTRSVIIASGQNLKRGTVMSEIALTLNGVTTGTPGGSNVGGGTLTGLTIGTKAKLGTYTAKCTLAPNSYENFLPQFEVLDPDGIMIGTAIQATAFTSPQCGFTINDGSPDFAVNDKFTFAVIAGTKKAVAFDSTATNGGANPLSILAEDVDATSADAGAIVNETGEFNELALIFANDDDTVDTVREALRVRGIHLKKNLPF